MGIFDSIVGRVTTDLSNKAAGGISSGVSGAVNKGIQGVKAPGPRQCPKCKKKIADLGMKFCPDDGTKLFLVCQKCKTEYPLDTKFCTKDGQALL
ncbi:MAG: zinc ribbon domain-containing protein [Candidatus Micrarchaeota archaeon]